ncbi:MAG: SOS response-associated peptidase [Lysobacterales bacterium CG_4_9_14_3_um_filter_62_6]|nr:MAG: SOS response-associated peptidase [Xanthomonadales bacterium CG_4_9_14_3_um_filter_62_6]
MCGRFTQTQSWQEVWQFMQPLPLVGPEQLLPPSFNLAPSQRAYVIAGDVQTGLGFATPTWGLLPSWAKDSTLPRQINARAETVAEKPYFRSAYRHTRCLVPVAGWYEWKQTAAGKQPWYLTSVDARPLLLAGLVSDWHAGAGDHEQTFAILTTTANASAARVHERMPVVLSAAEAPIWLDHQNGSGKQALPWLAPCPDAWIRAWPVSNAVNTPRNNEARLLDPVAPLDTVL